MRALKIRFRHPQLKVAGGKQWRRNFSRTHWYRIMRVYLMATDGKQLVSDSRTNVAERMCSIDRLISSTLPTAITLFGAWQAALSATLCKLRCFKEREILRRHFRDTISVALSWD